MSLLSRLFGKSPSPSEPAEEYKGFSIRPDLGKSGSQFRLGARIEKEIDGTLRNHDLIRADTFQDRDQAVTASLAKARQVIDEQGDRLFR